MGAFTSRTARAPNNYKRKFTISVHALDRFRERVDEEFRHRDEYDLGNLLDDKLRQCKNPNTVRDPRAPEEVTYLYQIETRKNGAFYVVVRNETAVTVLDPDMAQRNFQQTWAQTLNSPFNNDSLKKVMDDMQTAPRPKLAPKDEAILRGNVPPPAPAPSPPPPSPLEAAGARYARALKQQHDCELALERAKQTVADAETALQASRDEQSLALQELTALAGTK
jgi:hypothetical protein